MQTSNNEMVFSRFKKIHNEILNKKTNLVVVTKGRSFSNFEEIVRSGHIHYGENKVQEAKIKWTTIREKYLKIKLHLIGGLQSNKAKDAVQLFDYIHSVDSIKLANELKKFELKFNLKRKYFIQVNIGDEEQKSGVSLNNLDNLFNFCKSADQLNIIGLMCIPPANLDPSSFFKKLNELNNHYKLNDISMGMSNDYSIALAHGSTFIRVGSAIFNDT